MVQFVRPIADTAAGSWATTPFFSKIDEDIGGGGDDVTVASEAVANNTDTTFLDLEGTNSGLTDPSSSINHILRVLWASSSTRDITAHLELWQGIPDTGTLIADNTIGLLDATEVQTNYTLTGTEADNITDYNDLYFRLRGRGLGGGPDRSLVVDAIELEVPTGGTAFTEAVDDDLGLADSTTVKQGKTITDALGLTDLITRVAPAVRVVTDALGLTDSTPHALDAKREISDDLGLTDSISAELTIKVEITDPLGLTDSTTTVKTLRQTISDALGLTDTTARVIAAFRTVTDALGLTDSTSKVSDIARTISDDLGLQDSTVDDLTVGGGDKFETVTDPLGLLDSTTRVHDAERIVFDALGLEDSIASAKTIRVEITDALGLSDSTTSAKAITVEISDALGYQDTTSRVVDYANVIFDALGLADSTSRVVDYARVVDEALGLADDTTDNLITAGTFFFQKDVVPFTKDLVPFTKRKPGDP